MSEFRQDIVTKEWVLVAPSRSPRPQEFKKDAATPESLPERAPACIFCPGNEKTTPAPLAQYPKTGEWQIRVVPNKFGLLELAESPPQRDFYVRLPGIGSHEVLITRYHNQPVALQSVALIDQVLAAYTERINELSTYEAVRYVHIIQNHGKLGGASLIHPHSQIIAMPFPGPHLQEELRGANHHYDIFDHCIYCEIILHEKKEQVRVVFETERFLAACPFESKMPYQVRIMPKRHEARFNRITVEERGELAAVMKAVLTKIYHRLGNPAYNYYFHTLPFSRSTNVASNENAYHWHLVIMPRINIWAGLELGTEVYVNVVPPEQAAEFLRG
ncbi:MAG: galactose-1-phosphate uridylyltransferase [Candidatus Doudnabacteria bacterium]|nr:galactose-1-phosphate uridylyltransferase [Candidatus Doudnabacteria bacterium]